MEQENVRERDENTLHVLNSHTFTILNAKFVMKQCRQDEFQC